MTSPRTLVALFGIVGVVAAIGVFAFRQTGEPPDGAARESPGAETGEVAGKAARDFDIVTILPKDAIPAIFEPEFLLGVDGGRQLNDGELVLGVTINGDARAYGVAYLSGHEIVNDRVGGRPIAVTW